MILLGSWKRRLENGRDGGRVPSIVNYATEQDSLRLTESKDSRGEQDVSMGECIIN